MTEEEFQQYGNQKAVTTKLHPPTKFSYSVYPIQGCRMGLEPNPAVIQGTPWTVCGRTNTE